MARGKRFAARANISLLRTHAIAMGGYVERENSWGSMAYGKNKVEVWAMRWLEGLSREEG